MILTRAGEADGSRVRFPIELGPREDWSAARRRRRLALRRRDRPAGRRAALRRGASPRPRLARRLAAEGAAAPRELGTRSATRSSQSVADLAALRMRGGNNGDGVGMLPAAGMPWFMTVFGRDTLITCLQTMLLGPDLAVSALDALAELQAQEDDPTIDAEPGKIVHELRRGRAAETWFGTLLRLGRRDAALPRAALRGLALDRRRGGRHAPTRPGARRARVDRPLRRPGRRRVRRVPAAHRARARQPVVEGLGRLAAVRRRRARRAADRARPRCRVTSTTRSCGSPSSRARSGATAGSRSGSRPRRPSCKRASTRRSGSDARGGYYALALDARQAPRRLALLEPRAPALERDRAGGAGGGGGRPPA